MHVLWSAQPPVIPSTPTYNTRLATGKPSNLDVYSRQDEFDSQTVQNCCASCGVSHIAFNKRERVRPRDVSTRNPGEPTVATSIHIEYMQASGIRRYASRYI